MDPYLSISPKTISMLPIAATTSAISLPSHIVGKVCKLARHAARICTRYGFAVPSLPTPRKRRSVGPQDDPVLSWSLRHAFRAHEQERVYGREIFIFVYLGRKAVGKIPRSPENSTSAFRRQPPNAQVCRHHALAAVH